MWIWTGPAIDLWCITEKNELALISEVCHATGRPCMHETIKLTAHSCGFWPF